MRTAIGFLSLLAFGFLAAGVLTVVGSGSGETLTVEAALGILPLGESGGIHLGSLTIGMMMGIVLSALSRVAWSELPRRVVVWMIRNERNFYRIVIAGILVGVLIFY